MCRGVCVTVFPPRLFLTCTCAVTSVSRNRHCRKLTVHADIPNTWCWLPSASRALLQILKGQVDRIFRIAEKVFIPGSKTVMFALVVHVPTFLFWSNRLLKATFKAGLPPSRPRAFFRGRNKTLPESCAWRLDADKTSRTRALKQQGNTWWSSGKKKKELKSRQKAV